MRLREFFDIREGDEEDPSSGIPDPIEDNPYAQGPSDQAVPEPIEDNPYAPQQGPQPAGGAPKLQPKPASSLKGPPTRQMMQWVPPPGARFGEPKPSPRRPVADPSTTPDPHAGMTPLARQTAKQSAPTRQIRTGAAPPEAAAAVHPWEREDGGLAEFFALDEMPRLKGSIGPAVRAMIDWARNQGSEEFSMRDLFHVWRKAGGQPNQTDDKKAYVSFQTSVRPLIARNRAEIGPEHPLFMTQAGTRGAQGESAYFRWVGDRGQGGQRPTGTPPPMPQVRKPQAAPPAEDDFSGEEPTSPGASPFDDVQDEPTAPNPAPEPEPEPEELSDDDYGLEPEDHRGPSWVPQPIEGGNPAEDAMFLLDKQLHLGPESHLWRDIARYAQVDDPNGAINALRNTERGGMGLSKYGRQKKLVARQIFQNLGKSPEGLL